jgi:hypothetical protein
MANVQRGSLSNPSPPSDIAVLMSLQNAGLGMRILISTLILFCLLKQFTNLRLFIFNGAVEFSELVPIIFDQTSPYICNMLLKSLTFHHINYLILLLFTQCS